MVVVLLFQAGWSKLKNIFWKDFNYWIINKRVVAMQKSL